MRCICCRAASCRLQASRRIARATGRADNAAARSPLAKYSNYVTFQILFSIARPLCKRTLHISLVARKRDKLITVEQSDGAHERVV